MHFSLPATPLCFLIATCWIASSNAQHDPLKDFCRRWGHQTAVVDDRLYIDGGLVNWKPFSASSQNETNPFFLFSDLNEVTEGMPTMHSDITKNATIPSVHGGILWEDSVNKRLYLYGGEYPRAPQNGFALYSYDILYDTWTLLGPPLGSSAVTPSSYGAGVSIPWKGDAYYYGGWLNNASVPGWTGPPRASNRLIKYTMDTNTWTNLTGPDDTRRAEGAMVYIPIGDAGMLVYFGGSEDLAADGNFVPEPLSKIYLYDIANTKWYTQTATGRIPENRRRFCAGATWAPDQSSYNIYIYGGAGFPPDTTGFDDIYILSIPSFQWIRGPYPPGSNVTGPYPKSMMSCNVINNAQMLVVGGTYSNDTTFMCDADPVWGQHNMDLGKQNPENAMWALYKPTLTTYAVPTDILTAVGGSPTGGAVTTTPVAGFSSPDLGVLLKRKANIKSRTPTRDVSVPTLGGASVRKPSSSSSSLSAGAIAGIVIGSVVGFIALVAGCIFCIRRRKKSYEDARQTNPLMSPGMSSHSPWGKSPAPPSATPAYYPPVELASEGVGGSTISGGYYTPARSPASGKYDHWSPPPVEMPLPSPRSPHSRHGSIIGSREGVPVPPGSSYPSPSLAVPTTPQYQPSGGEGTYDIDSVSRRGSSPSGFGIGQGSGVGMPIQPRWDEPRRGSNF